MPDAPSKYGPQATLGIIAYKQETFVAEAIQGAFAQTYPNLQIVFSDDCSPDNTFDVAKEIVETQDIGRTVLLNRNEHNLGLVGNVNRVMELATGEIILLAGGDDISLPDRVEHCVDLLRQHRDASCISMATKQFSGSTPDHVEQPNNIVIDEFSLNIYETNPMFHLNGAARAFRKEVFEEFGPLSTTSPTEDSTTLLRCMIAGTALRSNKKGVLHRVHGDNLFASDNRKQIDYESIHKQYLNDIETGLIKQLIDFETSESLKRWLDHRLAQKIAVRDLDRTEQPVLHWLRHVLPNRQLGVRKKLRLLKNRLKKATSSGTPGEA